MVDFDNLRTVFVDRITHGISAIRYGFSFGNHRPDTLLHKTALDFSPTLDEWNGGTHPLLYKLGVVEVETTLVVLTNIGESAF